MLIRPLPFHEPGELMLVQLLVPERETPGVFRKMVWSIPKYQVVRDRQQVFTATALFAGREWSLTNTDTPEHLQGEIVEGPYFGVLGVDARLGRMFGAADDRLGATPVAVISHSLWQRRFGGDPAVLGRTIGLDRHAVHHRRRCAPRLPRPARAGRRVAAAVDDRSVRFRPRRIHTAIPRWRGEGPP